MDWMQKYVDIVIILGSVAGSLLWMNGKFNEIEKDLTIIKTVLVMKNIMPLDLATNRIENHE